jgi:hypothetical protein
MWFCKIIPFLKEVQSMSMSFQNLATIHCFAHEPGQGISNCLVKSLDIFPVPTLSRCHNPGHKRSPRCVQLDDLNPLPQSILDCCQILHKEYASLGSLYIIRGALQHYCLLFLH